MLSVFVVSQYSELGRVPPGPKCANPDRHLTRAYQQTLRHVDILHQLFIRRQVCRLIGAIALLLIRK
jgi:hypothetical protein